MPSKHRLTLTPKMSVREVIESAITLGIVDSYDPPDMSIIFRDYEIITKTVGDTQIEKELSIYRMLEVKSDMITPENLRALVNPDACNVKFFDTGITFNDVYDMQVKSVEVTDITFFAHGHEFVGLTSIMIIIPGLGRKIDEASNEEILS